MTAADSPLDPTVPNRPGASPPPPADATANSSASVQAAAPVASPETLTPEEQMALFEKELKETDWGHQPC